MDREAEITIEYEPYSRTNYLSDEKIALIQKIFNAHLTEEELNAVCDKSTEILYRRNDVTKWGKMVEITKED